MNILIFLYIASEILLATSMFYIIYIICFNIRRKFIKRPRDTEYNFVEKIIHFNLHDHCFAV
jgi:hypothetical protein